MLPEGAALDVVDEEDGAEVEVVGCFFFDEVAFCYDCWRWGGGEGACGWCWCGGCCVGCWDWGAELSGAEDVGEEGVVV